jgi:type I restriction enzyme S subunit
VGTVQQPFDGLKKYADTSSVGIGSIDEGVDVSFLEKPSRANLVFDEGTVVFAKMAKTKKAFIVDKEHVDWVYSTGFYGLKPKKGFSSKYLFAYLLSDNFNFQKDSNANGITMAALNNSGLTKITIKNHSPKEQEFITSELFSILKAIEDVKKEISFLDDLIESRFLETFGNVSTNDKDFDFGPLGNECLEIGDGLHGTPIYDDSGSYYFINGNNLGNDKIIFTKETKTVGKEEFLKYYIPFDENTVFLSINGTLGNVAVYDGEQVILGKSAAYCKLGPSLRRRFVVALFKTSNFRKYMEDNSSGSTITNFGLKAFRNFQIIIPPISLQDSFSNFAKKADETKTCCQKEIDYLNELFSLKMHQYFD